MPTKADLAREYRRKHGMEMPTNTLAALLYKEQSALFKDKEEARTHLRRIEGKTGAKARKQLADKSLVVEEHRTRTPYQIPVPDSEDLIPYKLPKSWDRFILAGDFHVPNHRIEPIEAMIRYAKEQNIKKLYINGDLLDNSPFTRWDSEPITPSDVPRWFDMAEELLNFLLQEFEEITFAEGNHDFWFKRYLMNKAKELFGDKYFHLENRLRLKEKGIKFISQKHLVKAGKLNIHHGHLTFRGGGGYANAARMLYMKTKSSMICSHVHVESSHTEPDIDNKMATTFTTGCMCTLSPDYQPFGGKACHGFADISVHSNGNFNVRNFRIDKGTIL